MNRADRKRAGTAVPADPSRAEVLRRFQEIPSVGPKTADDLWRLGYRTTAELAGQDPQAMYEKLCRLKGVRIDPCQLYMFRCIVYTATRRSPKPELQKWWAWKDRTKI